MNRILQEYINGLKNEVADIPKQRKKKLQKISDFIWTKLQDKAQARLIFVCTHNSRRSQMCQVWAATLSFHFGLYDIETFSGGTEVTAFNPRAVEALKRAGFSIENPGGENPHYNVFFDKDKEPFICYSKRFDSSANPGDDFAAVMTCSDADQHCPVVPGTAFRITIPYEDPKQADGTLHESRTYDERCLQIATEMFYMLSQLN